MLTQFESGKSWVVRTRLYRKSDRKVSENRPRMKANKGREGTRTVWTSPCTSEPFAAWVPFSLALLEAYNDPFVLAEVRKRLIIPRGWSAIWWKLRTDYVNRSVMIERIDRLNTALSEYRLTAGAVTP